MFKMLSLLFKFENVYDIFFLNTIFFILFFFLFYILLSLIFFVLLGNYNFTEKKINYFFLFLIKSKSKFLDISDIALYQSFLIFCFIVYYLTFYLNFNWNHILNWNFFFEFNNFYLIFTIILFFFFIIILIFWNFYFKDKYKLDIFTLLWISFFSLFLLIISKNLLFIYLSLEILAVSSYALIASQYNSSLSVEAALKYLILAAISSGIFVLGIFFFYLISGTFDIYEFFFFFNYEDTLFSPSIFFICYYLSFFCIFIGLFFKIGLAPFHFWMPDVYQGSILPMTSFFALLPKLAYIIVFLKFIILFNFSYTLSIDKTWIEYFFLLISSLSLVIGSLGALNQIKIKRFLAYSAMTHMSYILYTLIFIYSYENYLISLIYLFSYIFLTLGIFSVLLSFPQLKIFHFLSSFSLKFNFLNNQWFFLILMWISFFFSLAGIPPFIGFFSKLLVLKILLKTPYYFFIFFISFFSVVSLFYYLKFIIFSFFLPTLKENNVLNFWFIFNPSYFPLLFITIYCFLLNSLFFLDIDFLLIFFNLWFKLTFIYIYPLF